MSFEEENELMRRNIEFLDGRIKAHNRRCESICNDRRQAAECRSLYHSCLLCPKNLMIEEQA